MKIEPHPEQAGQYRLTAETLVSQPLDEVFTFFSDARNLESITPSWLKFQVLTPEPLEMRQGTLIDYRLKVHGVPLRWQSRIAVWEPPHRFVDEQVRGPYRRWWHEHIFESTDGGTRCIDRVDYAVPGGALVNRLFVRRDLATIFAYRQQCLRDIFATATAAS